MSEQEQQAAAVLSTHELDIEITEFDLQGAPASTTLTPHELYLMNQLGYEPIQVVTGNIVYSMGVGGVWRSIKKGLRRGEVPDFTRILNDARVIARNRMLKAAIELGADRVVGVIFESKEFADFIEMTAMGTAVKKTNNGSANTHISVGI